MGQYICGRLLAAFPVLLGVTLAAFLMLQLVPGDPVAAMLGQQGADPAAVAQTRQQLGLERPLPVQYVRFVLRALHGDLGRSILSHRPVLDQIMDLLPSTVQLALCALAISTVVGVSAGVVAAIGHRTWIDSTAMVLAVAGVASPTFFVALLLIFVFSVQLGWLPATGAGSASALILPAVTLGLPSAALLARLVRSSMLEVLRLDFIRAARAKGLRNHTVILRHALKNALIPVVTTVGAQFGAMLGGTIIIETVFARPGIGQLVLQAVLNKDFPLVQGEVLFTAMVYVLINLAVDISYGFLDPRIRFGG
ncbi:MAG TPA: ABC transporter permease [Dehalococcoidia bacterium]|nr:ABC transporter permease [Dehalococcoidia bacterium]